MLANSRPLVDLLHISPLRPPADPEDWQELVMRAADRAPRSSGSWTRPAQLRTGFVAPMIGRGARGLEPATTDRANRTVNGRWTRPLHPAPR